MKFREDVLNQKMGGGTGVARLKLKDGQEVTGIFVGDIHGFYQVWPDGGQKTVAAEYFPGSGFRFEVYFLVKEGTGYVPKVFENGVKVYKQLAALHKEYDLTKTVFKITRSGNNKNNTTYSFLPQKQAPSKETLAYIDSLKLEPLGGAPPQEKTAVKNYAPGAGDIDEPEF